MNWGDYFQGPNLGPLSPLFANKLTTVVSIVWFMCLLWAAVMLMVGIAKFAKAKRQHQGVTMGEALEDCVAPTISLVVLTMFLAVVIFITSF